MTQAIIDNAAAISLDTDTTISQTVTNSRQLKWFRKGPIQHVAEVQINVLTASTYRPIRGDLQSNLLGAYVLRFPEEVTGVAGNDVGQINGTGQTGTNIAIDGLPGSQLIYAQGTLVQFGGVNQVFIVTEDVMSDPAGDALVTINYPIPSPPTNGGSITSGPDCAFHMYLVNKPTASFGPTGLVNHDGPFRFVEEF